MSFALNSGHQIVVGFLGLCATLGIFNLGRGLLSGTQEGMFFGLAQAVFALFAGAAAWNIHHWKKIGWFLGCWVVLQWISGLVNLKVQIGWLTIALTFPMLTVGVWLYLPVVRSRFDIKKVFG